MLAVCGRIGMDGGRYQAIEYRGEAVAALSMQERMTLSNMAAELGGQAGLIAPDAVTADYISAAGGDPGDWQRLRTDAGAALMAHHAMDASALEPQAAAPHSPANAAAVSDVEATPIDVAYIGACTGAKYEDLKNAASILQGRSRRPARGTARCTGLETRPGTRRNGWDHGGFRGCRGQRSCPMPAASARDTALTGWARTSPAFHRRHAISKAGWARPLPMCGWHRPIPSPHRLSPERLPIHEISSAMGRIRNEQPHFPFPATISTPTRWRRANICAAEWRLLAAHCLEGVRPDFAGERAAGGHRPSQAGISASDRHGTRQPRH